MANVSCAILVFLNSLLAVILTTVYYALRKIVSHFFAWRQSRNTIYSTLILLLWVPIEAVFYTVMCVISLTSYQYIFDHSLPLTLRFRKSVAVLALTFSYVRLKTSQPNCERGGMAHRDVLMLLKSRRKKHWSNDALFSGFSSSNS